MYRLEFLLLFFFGPLLVNATYDNLLSQLITRRTGSASSHTGSDECSGASLSCLPAPWCRQTTDERGCARCECSQGNTQNKNSNPVFATDNRQQNVPQSFSPFFNMLSGASAPGFGANSGAGFMSGVNPGFGGSQMGPMNPMASIFGANSMHGGGGLSGPMGGTGGVPNVPHGPQHSAGTGNDCGPAPYTCMAPPPWCQRLPDLKGCINCYCGQELTNYLQTLNTITNKPETTSRGNESLETTSDTSMGTTLSAISGSTDAVTMTTVRPPLGKPCLATFMCTLSCDTGYQTDKDECPVCACMTDKDLNIYGTLSLNDHSTLLNQQSALPTSTPDNGIILCPGVFDCDTVCMTGYKTDANGCPICQCEID